MTSLQQLQAALAAGYVVVHPASQGISPQQWLQGNASILDALAAGFRLTVSLVLLPPIEAEASRETHEHWLRPLVGILTRELVSELGGDP